MRRYFGFYGTFTTMILEIQRQNPFPKRLQPALPLIFLLVSCVGMHLQADVIDDILAAKDAKIKAALNKVNTKYLIKDYQALIEKGMETGNAPPDLLRHWQNKIDELEDDQRNGKGAELDRKAENLDRIAEQNTRKFLQGTATYVGRTRMETSRSSYEPGYGVGGAGRVQWPPESGGSASKSSNFVDYGRYYPPGRSHPSHPGQTGGN